MVLQKKRKGAITMKRKLWGLLLTAVLFTSAFGVLPVWAAEADGSFTVADTEISINGEATPVLAAREGRLTRGVGAYSGILLCNRRAAWAQARSKGSGVTDSWGECGR